jgi:alkylation response protein AidB-like acyl-CoA dehydrogenase
MKPMDEIIFLAFRQFNYLWELTIIYMNTETIDNIKMIAETAREFAEKNIRPNIMEWDESQTFPKDLFHQLGEMGFMGIVVPEQYGGSGLGYHEYVAILDEISQVDPSIGLSVAAHNSLCTNHIYEFGNEEQRNKWLPQLASGKVIGAWGLTEHNTGSDSGGMSTTAVKMVTNGSLTVLKTSLLTLFQEILL